MSVEKEEKKEQTPEANILLKVETPKVTVAPSIQEPLLKVEVKEEETIHDSDFEEPSGIYCLFFSPLGWQILFINISLCLRTGRCSFPEPFTS